ncbi:MAG: DUF502 domain-containing protein [Desulfonauticus sp.]|nr:DUF502 domain-containing protein [Desulfonauticus sp.]
MAFFKNVFQRLKDFLKTNLIAGILFLTPLAATFFFLKFVISWLDQISSIVPLQYRPEHYLPFPIPGLGLIILFVILLFTGIFVRNYLGKKLVQLWEYIISKIPLVNKFYTAIKQMLETIVKGGTKDFKRVVLVEFPRAGIYSLGYVTGIASGEIQTKTKKKVLNVYVPTTPNPTSGYYLIVPEEEVIPLEMSVEDSFKLLISGGIINPNSEQDKNKKK